MAVFALAAGSLLAPNVPCIGGGKAWAVKPPSQDVRKKAEKDHEKKKKAKARVECRGGCPYGKDKVTGKCYKPKEGQFYLDCRTGEVKFKEVECINLPWRPCGGSSGGASKKKAKEKQKSKEVGKRSAKKSPATGAAAKPKSKSSASGPSVKKEAAKAEPEKVEKKTEPQRAADEAVAPEKSEARKVGSDVLN